MPLGIGNNLIRNGGGLNPDKLALDLQFAADKAYAADGTVVNGTGQFNITSRKGPPAKFTRGSGATFVDSDGLIKYAPENILLRSQEFNLTWGINNSMTVTPDAVIAPDGTMTADAINFDSNVSSRIIQFAGSAAIHTFSVWLRANSATTCLLDGQAVGSASSPVVVNVTTNWQRFTYLTSNFLSGTAAWNIRIQNNSTGTSGTIFAWGAQLERHTSARAYIPTTTAVAYAPRFDHDPVTLASRGLLIEEQRQNLVLQSENHPSASWNKTGVTISAVTQTAPDGNTNSNLVSEDSSTGLHRTFQGNAYVNGTSYAISVFLKFAGRQFVAITHPAVATNNIAIFDIQNGSVTLQQSGITASMVQYPNGWWRCVIVGTSSTTSSQSHIIQGSTTGGSLTGSYTGLNGAAFYIYGSQVEAGSFATSYIPTTTSSLTRSADVCSISSITSFYAGLGTIFASSQLNGLSQLNGICGFNTFNSNQICINRLTSTTRASTLGASPTVVINSAANLPATTFVKSAFAFNINDAAYFNNNVLAGTATSLTLPSVTEFQIGRNGGAGSQFIQSGTIAAIRYYKKRLPNEKLQALTA